VKITVDTNVLVRVLLNDDAAQADAARRLLSRAELIAIPLPVLCELVWVLRRLYRRPIADVLTALEAVLRTERVVVDAAAVEAGLDVLRRGGDFADGVAAHTGAALGGTIFASFDVNAVRIRLAQGDAAADPSSLVEAHSRM
jgi:predicted nucleic-acid-binding protein